MVLNDHMTMIVNVSKKKKKKAFGFEKKESWIKFWLRVLNILQNVEDGLILINGSNSEATMQYL